MRIFSISWHEPGTRARIIIVMVIYVIFFRLAPQDAVPVILGSVGGGILAAEPSRVSSASRTLEG